jgi:pimeloyl-ACP methyl ester carboxylesterase
VQSRVPTREPRLEAAGEASEAAGAREAAAVRCPLDELPPGVTYDPTRMDPKAARAGLQLDTFAMPIPGCPPLVRRTLSYVPPGLVRGPLLIVLHDGGASAESVRARQAQATFEERAKLFGFIVVYADAAPAAGRSPDSGVWQTDPGANRAIDDFAYLARVVERLDQRGLLYEAGGLGPDVYLVGYGSGARLALEAAAQHPERYVGVAALLPDQLNRSRPPPRRADARLSRVFFVTLQDERPGVYWPGAPLTVAWIKDWGAAIGFQAPAGQPPPLNLGTDVQPLGPAIDAPSLLARGIVPAGTRFFDSAFPDKGGQFLRVLVVQSKTALDVGPGGRPAPVDAATLVWEFFARGAPRYPGAAWPDLPSPAVP